MERLDYVEEIRSSDISKETLGFHHILQELNKIDSFEGSLMHAQGGNLPIIKHHDIFVRQHLMLCEMGAYTSWPILNNFLYL